VGKMTEVQVQSREIPVLETVEDIERRREQVLRRYAEFKEATRLKRLRLEEAKRYHQWKRDVDECEIWINEKLQIASDESFKDATNLQVLFCKIYEIFIAEKLVKKNF
jgi:spectrin alpha